MKVSKDTPQWVADLVTQICKEYKRTPPGDLVCKSRTDYKHSSGVCHTTRNTKGGKMYIRTDAGRLIVFLGRINITLGTNDIDARHVVLHEIAHWITNKSRPCGHTTKFYKLVFKLHVDYKADLEWAYCREGLYMKTSKTVFENNFAKAHNIKPMQSHAMRSLIHYSEKTKSNNTN